jgi:ankyrin repeat protein
MLEVPDDRCERHRLFQAIDDAFKAGNFTALGAALGGSPRWFDEHMPFELGLGHPLEYAIYWSPIGLIGELLSAGASANYGQHDGFPSIIAALGTKRADRLAIVRLLIDSGADPNMRGINDWTPLHYAAGLGDEAAIHVLLSAGADPSLRTRIDQYEMPAREAERAGHAACATLLRAAVGNDRDC